MAQIVINEISQNYTYNIGSNSFATVAFPITAAWGPAFSNPSQITSGGKDIFDLATNATSEDIEEALENVAFQRFPATQAGLEAFVATYRGPESHYRLAKDYSYQIAMTLLTSGYDVLVCRVCPGTFAENSFIALDSGTEGFNIKAKYPGSFGNQLSVVIKFRPLTKTYGYWNVITYMKDSSGYRTAVENLSFVVEQEHSNDNLLYIDEIESNFIDISVLEKLTDDIKYAIVNNTVDLTGGSDVDTTEKTTVDAIMEAALKYASYRYAKAGYTVKNTDGNINEKIQYVKLISDLATGTADVRKVDDTTTASIIRHNEWVYTAAFTVFDLLEDKLSYNPNRAIVPGWDDQDIVGLGGTVNVDFGLTQISPLHKKLMHVGYYSRCATALLDIPRSEPRSRVYDESQETAGYAQMLARYGVEVNVGNSGSTVPVEGLTNPLYPTHSALCGPWGQFTYVGTSKQNIASPSFLTLMIQRAMLLNQSLQYEWALPTNRTHNLRIGKLDYKVNHKLLNKWQSLEGVGVNVITDIPGLGITLWGNSTLYEVPPATYQALANLSTRYLVNAVEDVAYKCGTSITFQYNNDQAYNKFYAGVTPICDTMKDVGAIEDYYIEMSADINGLDRVNANTIIGKIYLVINGVVNDIYIDLIALPPGTDLNQYRS